MQYQLKTERNATEKAELTGRESHERIVKTLRAAEHKLDQLEEARNLGISCVSVSCRTSQFCLPLLCVQDNSQCWCVGQGASQSTEFRVTCAAAAARMEEAQVRAARSLHTASAVVWQGVSIECVG